MNFGYDNFFLFDETKTLTCIHSSLQEEVPKFAIPTASGHARHGTSDLDADFNPICFTAKTISCNMGTLSITGVILYQSSPKFTESAICTYMQSAHAPIQKPSDRFFRCRACSRVLFFFLVLFPKKHYREWVALPLPYTPSVRFCLPHSVLLRNKF